MRKINKYFLVIISLLLLMIPMIVSTPTKADSGWDYSYDSGGSYSDYSSSSSWSSSDYSYDFDIGGSSNSHSYSHNGEGAGDPTTAIFIFVGFMFIVLLITVYASNRNDAYIAKRAPKLVGMTEEAINAYNIGMNKEEIINMTFDIYKNVQIAWMDFDYEVLENNLTDELYNNYKMLLETLKIKDQKNIMKDITLVDGAVKRITKNDLDETIVVLLSVRVIDYVVSNLSKSTVRGSRKPVLINYEITITRSGNTKEELCPSCGVKLVKKNHRRCPFCDSIIVSKNDKFVMSKKEVI